MKWNEKRKRYLRAGFQVQNELRQICDPEMKQFNRGSRLETLRDVEHRDRPNPMAIEPGLGHAIKSWKMRSKRDVQFKG
jgi:hypothetical protein